MHEYKKVLFLVPYPLHRAPSQRFRVELFLSLLEKQGIQYTIAPFLDEKAFEILYKNGNIIKKISGFVRGFIGRAYTMMTAVRSSDYVFVHREAAPIGPPLFEWIVARVLRKKMIYDFDDAIWIADSKNKALNWIKSYWKVKWICRWSAKVAAGNQFLCSYAEKYASKVVLLPTCVDTVGGHNRVKEQRGQVLSIGWTGSHSTLKYLYPLYPVLLEISKNHVIDFVIICNQSPDFNLPRLRFIQWKEASELDDLLQINIGLMPLMNDAWSEGKCGFKLIQYLALGIPALASPVGVNKEIIEHGKNGFLCSNAEEWKFYLEELIRNENKRTQMGHEGHRKIEQEFSIQANADVFFGLFD